jgi:hypothetical protein
MAVPNIIKQKPVMSSATVTAVLSAIYAATAAFGWWTFTDSQQAAVAGLIGALALVFGKQAASHVYIPETVNTIVTTAVEETKVAEQAVAAEKIAAAEAFGVPDQNQAPVPLRPELWQMPAPPQA